MGSGRDAIWEQAGMYKPLNVPASPAVRILQEGLHQLESELGEGRKTMSDAKVDELIEAIVHVRVAIRGLT